MDIRQDYRNRPCYWSRSRTGYQGHHHGFPFWTVLIRWPERAAEPQITTKSCKSSGCERWNCCKADLLLLCIGDSIFFLVVRLIRQTYVVWQRLLIVLPKDNCCFVDSQKAEQRRRGEITHHSIHALAVRNKGLFICCISQQSQASDCSCRYGTYRSKEMLHIRYEFATSWSRRMLLRTITFMARLSVVLKRGIINVVFRWCQTPWKVRELWYCSWTVQQQITRCGVG